MGGADSGRVAQSRLLVLADSAFPTGAFAHSWGLEWAIRAGWVTGAADLRLWILDALRFGVAPLEGRAVERSARLAARCVTGERADAARAAGAMRLSDELASFLPSREARNASGQLGRSLLAAAGAAFPVLRRDADYDGVVRASRSHQERLQFAVAWGFVGGLLAIGAAALVQAHLLNTVRQWSQVAMRIIPIGQSAALDMIGRLLDDTVCLARETAESRAPLASVMPGWDLAIAGHSELDARYFRS